MLQLILKAKIDHCWPHSRKCSLSSPYRMYTAPEHDRLTPSPTDSPRSHQIVPSTRYTMQPLFQEQFVNSLPQNRFYNSERAVPQTNSLLTPQTEDGASQRWFVTSMQQGGNNTCNSNKLDLTPYEGEYSSSLIPYGIKSLSMQTSHALSYYPDSPFTMSAGWGSRAGYQRKVAPSLPWSPRPSPTACFSEDSHKIKPHIEEEVNGSGGLMSSWTEPPPSTLSLDKPDSYSTACKRRRLSLNGPGTEDSPTDIKCEDLASAATSNSSYIKDPPSAKGMAAYYSFYTTPWMSQKDFVSYFVSLVFLHVPPWKRICFFVMCQPSFCSGGENSFSLPWQWHRKYSKNIKILTPS